MRVRFIFLSIVVVLSLPVRANLLDNIVDSIKALLGGTSEPAIEMPLIPRQLKNTRAAIGYEQRKKSNVKFKEKDSQSYNYSYIVELFSSVRLRKPTTQELNKWMNVLSQSGSREGIYRALVLDNAYYNLEKTGDTVTQDGVAFAMDYVEVYVGRSFKREELNTFNFYTVKRNVVEKTLEVIDLLFRRPGEDIYDWYGLFSADLADRYQDIWQNEVRKNNSASYHKNWAMNVPDQYLKSEIIIKLHRVLNYLQSV